MKVTITGISFNIDCPQLEVIEDKLDKILRREKQIMGLIEDIDGKVDALKVANTNLNTALDNVRLGVEGMKTELEQLKTGEILSDVVAAKLQSISTKADEVLTIVADTMAENVPVAPLPPDGDVV